GAVALAIGTIAVASRVPARAPLPSALAPIANAASLSSVEPATTPVPSAAPLDVAPPEKKPSIAVKPHRPKSKAPAERSPRQPDERAPEPAENLFDSVR